MKLADLKPRLVKLCGLNEIEPLDDGVKTRAERMKAHWRNPEFRAAARAAIAESNSRRRKS